MSAFTPRHRFLLSVALFAAVVLLLFVLPFHPAVSLAAVFVSASVIFLLIGAQLRTCDVSDRLVYGIVAGAIVLRMCFLVMTPIGSDDFYRYIWDGRVQANGINPYRYAPEDTALAPLHSEQIPARINHADLRTVYFPLSLWTFYLSYELGGESVWGYKLMLLLAECAALTGLALVLRRLAIPLKYILLYALCPLPIVQFAVDAHLDGLGLPFLIFGILFHLKKEHLLSAVFFGVSMSIKPVALVMLPVLFFREKEWKNKIIYVTVPLAAVLIQFVPYMAGARPFDALFTFARNWNFNGAVFELVHYLLRDNQRARMVCAAMLSASLLALYGRKRVQSVDMLYYATLLLFLFSPVVHPWYLNWLAVLLPVTRRWSGIALAALACLTVTTTLPYILTGVWQQSGTILALEYVPVIMLMTWELWTTVKNGTRRTA